MSRNTSIIAAAVVITVFLSLLAGAAESKDSGVRKIEIKGRKYTPAKLTIKAGQSVIWSNRDDQDHQIIVTLDGKTVDESENLGRGDTFRFKFEKAGKYRFHCKLHPREKGEIIVE